MVVAALVTTEVDLAAADQIEKWWWIETRPSASRTGSRTGGSTLSRGTTSSSDGRALMRNSFTDLRDILDEVLGWVEKKGMGTMFGKRYPNCVKKKRKEKSLKFLKLKFKKDLVLLLD